MNYGSALNLTFFEKIGTFLDIIPKVIYFIFAALTSGVDAMQCLVRKLAGLDTYYHGGDAVVGTDPLTEFIYGILGIGDNAYVYKGLTTVFWSLAIFGLIVLVVSTVVAIIKSHYNEDTEGTNPWKYIYTAIKSVLTFAVMPVVVVFGMQLSSFVLRTLDNVTAGTVSEQSIKGVYGAQATELFHGETMRGNDYKSYMNYDIFGINIASNNTTFGGMLFEASLYTANRARSGNVSVEKYQQVTSGGKQIFGDSGNCPEFASLQTMAEKQEYVATQIDYAFSNNLQLSDSISYEEIIDIMGDDVKYWSGSDIFKFAGSGGSKFSKYDISFIWFFYNLWQFNFLIGYAGGIAIFGTMISIIVGLMTRLIKGAALFLVYPALLGIAPLDNFKAFKGWGTTFMQQILMAFGAIVGINLLLLIVPYLRSISFFGQKLIDLIVNVVILIAGLMMAKDFIAMVSGFVGGADALTTGDGAKGGIAGGFKNGLHGLKAGAGVGKALTRPVFAGAKVVGGGIVTAAKMTKATATKIKSSTKAKSMNREQKRISKARAKYEEKYKDAALKRNSAYKDRGINLTKADKALKEAGQRAYDKVKKRGGSDSEAEQARKAVKAKGLLKQAGDTAGLKEFKKYERMAKRNANKIKTLNKDQANLDTAVAKSKNNVKRNDEGKIVSSFDLRGNLKKAGGAYLKGEKLGLKGALGDVKSIGLDIADGFKKGIAEGLVPALGLDKLIKGGGDLFKDLRYTNFSTKVKLNGKEHELKAQGKIFGPAKPKDKTGDDLSKELAAKQQTATEAQTKAIEELVKAVGKSTTASKETTDAIKELGKSFKSGGTGNSGGNTGGNDSSNP